MNAAAGSWKSILDVGTVIPSGGAVTSSSIPASMTLPCASSETDLDSVRRCNECVDARELDVTLSTRCRWLPTRVVKTSESGTSERWWMYRRRPETDEDSKAPSWMKG